MSDRSAAVEALVPPAAVGFIGLGQMGRPMAACLIKAGFAVAAFDAAEAARRSFEEASGVPAAQSAASACRDVAAVITMLPNGAIVREVLYGTAGQGGLAAAAPGTVVIDMSSSSPIDTRALARELEPLGFPLVDAPVSGGVKRAVDGSLAIMAGGETGAIDRIRPLLNAMGKSIFPTGPLGSGHAMKALNNYVSAAGLAAAAEAIIIGGRFGLDPEIIVDVLNASTGRNNSTEVKMKQQVLSGGFASGFAMGLMTKDLHTAADIARHIGVAAPLASVCEALWAEAGEKLGAAADHTEIYRYLAELEDTP
ncbi:MAG: NAD(P)-dependent oxidoreductase [Kiloniellaceae bacterium]